MHWTLTTKADPRPRVLADRHYTRVRVGHPMWTRPGYTQILYYEQAPGRAAAFAWWRPKWEAGVERKDKLRCIECTLFRNETSVLSSLLIREAVEALLTWEHALDVDFTDGIVTGIRCGGNGRAAWQDAAPRALLPHGGLRGIRAPGERAARGRVAPVRRGAMRGASGAAPALRAAPAVLRGERACVGRASPRS